MKKRYARKETFKYVKPENDLWQLINACLYTACTHDNGKPSIDNGILTVKLRNGVVVRVENFIGNKAVQELRDTSKCYKDFKTFCPFDMGYNCGECAENY